MIYICILSLNNRPMIERLLDSMKGIVNNYDIFTCVLWQQYEGYLPIYPYPFLMGFRTPYNWGCAGGRQYLVDYLAGGRMTPDDIIVFLDDDMEASGAEWLDALTSPIVAGIADITGIDPRYIDAQGNSHPANGDKIEYVSGGWCAISAKVFLSGIQFDLQFNPNYFEDADLGYQARRAGFRIIGVENRGLVHHGSVEMLPAKNALVAANRTKFLAKWR